MDLRSLEPIRESVNEDRSSKDLNDVELMLSGSHQHDKPVLHVIEKETPHMVLEQKHTNEEHGDHDLSHPLQPLLEPDRGRQKPPLAGPEIDDLDDIDAPSTETFSGIDDGLLDDPPDPDRNGHKGDDEHTDKNGEKPGINGIDLTPRVGGTDNTHGDDDPNGLDVNFNRPISPAPGSIPDVNTYQQKKNLAQGMMDLALLSANANQLRYVLDSNTTHPYYYLNLVFIALSILFQIGVGVGLILNSRYDVKHEKEICKADKINNMTVVGVFLITIVNVFITSFSISTPTVLTAPGTALQQAG